MKRCLLLLLCLALLGSLLPAAAIGETVHSYDFDFHFHLEPAAFSPETRQRIQGYADLLEMLEVKGSWTYCDERRSVDTSFTVIPTTKPEAALSFHLYGYPSHIVLASPLLGDQIIFFNNEALLEFCLKAYEHLGVPLYTLGLLFPYSFDNAFSRAAAAWREAAGGFGEDRTISAKALKACADTWADLLENDGALNDWITAVSLRNEELEILRPELLQAPEYLTDVFANGGSLRVDHNRGEEVWTAGKTVLLRESRQEDSYLLETSLPPTQSGYQPAFRFEKNEKEETTEASLLISYTAAEDTGEEPVVDLRAELLWPSVWPAASGYASRISLNSSLLGLLQLELQLDCRPDGSFEMRFIKPLYGEMTEAMLLQGVLTPRENVEAPAFSLGEILTYVNIFSVNDVTLDAFVRAVARPAVTGALAFLVEVPASAMQSVMDDLTDFGVLGVLLGD